MKTLNYLVFATLTFTAAAHADPVADLSAQLSENLNRQFNQISAEMTAQIHVSLENRMAEMFEQFDRKQAATELTVPVPAESAAMQVTATQGITAETVQ